MLAPVEVPQITDVYTFLVEHALPNWYDVFLSLGIERSILDESARTHFYNPILSVKDMTAIWLEKRKHSPATLWESLANTLRYDLFQVEAADKLQELHCSKHSCKCAWSSCVYTYVQDLLHESD